MGICASCLGRNRREPHDVSPLLYPFAEIKTSARSQHSSLPLRPTPPTLFASIIYNPKTNLSPSLQPNHPESSRLLDEDIYQPGYGYGALNQSAQGNHPDPSYLKREREALEAICQRTSE